MQAVMDFMIFFETLSDAAADKIGKYKDSRKNHIIFPSSQSHMKIAFRYSEEGRKYLTYKVVD